MKQIYTFKNIFLLIILIFLGFSNSPLVCQDGNSDKKTSFWLAEDFSSYKISDEITNRRSENEKHFQREDGQVDMFVSSEPINYLDNGNWKTIYNTIIKDNNGIYEFSNLNNTFKSYYPENIQSGFKTILNGQELLEMRNATMYYESNGQKLDVLNISSSQGSANGNKLTYEKVYGNAIDLLVTQSGGKRKLDYIIKDRSAINDAYSNAQYLVFSEEILLPKGWSAKMENGVILLIDASGEVASAYEKPTVFDSNESLEFKNNQNTSNYDTSMEQVYAKTLEDSNNKQNFQINENISYDIQIDNNEMTILTKVDLNYLLDNNRVFPIFIDPTLTATHNASGWSYSWFAPYGPPAITTTGAPAGSSITNTNVVFNAMNNAYHVGAWYFYSGFCGSWHSYGLFDWQIGSPTYGTGPTDIILNCGGNTNFFNCYNPNRTWLSELISMDGYNYAAYYGFTVTVTYETVTAPTSIAGTTSICSGSSTTLTASGGAASAGSTAINTQWFSGSCGGTLLGTGNSITVSPTATTTYYTRRVGQCSTTGCASVTINVDQPNIAPTISGGGTFCFGEQVTLTATGGNIPAGQFSWFENAVTNPSIGTGGSVTVSPNGTTDYIVEVHANGACAAASSNTITVTVPTPDNTLSVNNSQSTCTVNQNGYIHFLDPNGKLIASINSNGQNLGNVTATSYVEAAPLQVQDCASSILTSVLDRHWVITPQFQPTGPVEVVLPMEQNEEQSLVTNANSNSNPDDDLVGLTDIVLTKYAGPSNVDNDFQNNCFSQGGNETLDLFTQGMSGFVDGYWPSYTGNDLYASYNINSFSEFWLHGSSNLSPLPVSLTSFNANCQSDNFTEVTWETASEMNASHFIVERSRDGVSWSNEHEVDAAGNANTLNSYSFEDHNVGIGFEGYYRLRQVDFDGEQTVYGPISVQCDEIKNAYMEVFPNPSSGSFTLRIFNNLKVEDANIVIQDVNGKVIQQQKTNINNGITTLLYDQKQLVKGMYYIRVIADGFDMAPKKLVIN